MMVAAVVTMVVMVVLIGCGVVSSLDCRSQHRLPHAYSQPKDHMAMASVRMHGRRRWRETPRQHRAVQRPTQQRVRERVSVEGEGWG
jgi:hypothetical protein